MFEILLAIKVKEIQGPSNKNVRLNQSTKSQVRKHQHHPSSTYDTRYLDKLVTL